jgi:hypothetical protein
MLERFGAKGPVVDYARVLAGMRVEIPVTGTRLEPRLDLANVDVGPLIEYAVGILVTEEVGKVLEDVLGGEIKQDTPPNEPKQPADTRPRDDAQILLEELFDLLRK